MRCAPHFCSCRGPARPLRRGFPHAALKPDASGVKTRDRFGNLGLANDERRQQTRDIFGRWYDKDFFGTCGSGKVINRDAQGDALHQSFPANLRDDLAMLLLQSGKALLEAQTHQANMFDKARRQHDVEHGVSNARGKRIAAIGGAMRAGGHSSCRFLGRQKGTQRETAADPLGNRHNVGSNPVKLVSKELPGAANAGLHLVQHQEKTMRVAKLTQRAQEARRWRANASLTLDRFDQNSARLRPDCGFHRFDVTKWNRVEARDPWTETIEVFRVARCADRRQRSSMEGPSEGYDVEFFRMPPR